MAIRDRAKCADRQAVAHGEAERMQHPARRVGRPADIAAAVLYVHAGFVTGQTLIVGRGISKRMI